MSEEELKPCPFCGSSEVALGYDTRNYLEVYCTKCLAAGPRGSINQQAIDNWNTRHEDRSSR